MRLLASLLLVLAATAVQGGEVIESHIEHSGNRYSIRMVMHVDVDATTVYNTLTDYANFTQLDESILESTLVHAAHPHYQVRVVTNSCALFFCKEMVVFENVKELPNGVVQVDVDPAQSDFHYGRMLWQITPHENGTRVSFDGELEPSFWVPPLLGPMLFKSGFLKETRNMIEGVERIAADPNTSATADIHNTTPGVVPTTRTP